MYKLLLIFCIENGAILRRQKVVAYHRVKQKAEHLILLTDPNKGKKRLYQGCKKYERIKMHRLFRTSHKQHTNFKPSEAKQNLEANN